MEAAFTAIPLLNIKLNTQEYVQLDVYANGIPVNKNYSMYTRKEPYDRSATGPTFVLTLL